MLKKVRHRHLALEFDGEGAFSSKEFMDAVWSAVMRLYGEVGASKTGLTLISFDGEKGFVVVRVLHSAVDMVRAALASMTRIGDKRVVVRVLVVSGTIKGVYRGLGKERRLCSRGD